MTPIADAGLLIALRSKSAGQREWAMSVFETHLRPILTCEAALTEAAHFCGAEFVAALLEQGEVVVAFDLQEQRDRVCALVRKYAGRMDLADACVVRMTELFPDGKVFTVDRDDFRFYRRNGTEEIPHEVGPV
jgi:predicted nucleic acid-binding protein